MPIEFACESCSELLRVPDGSAGLTCQCPSCQMLLEIPDPDDVVMVELIGDKLTWDNTVSQRLTILCPKCRFTLNCTASLLGTKGQCRNCNYIFVISTQPSNSVARDVASQVFSCPKCSQLFEGKPEMNGRKGKCHICGEVFAIQLRAAERPSISQAKSRGTTAKETNSNQGSFTKSRRPAAANSLHLACPNCDGVMAVPSAAAGQTTACPFCHQLLEIPH